MPNQPIFSVTLESHFIFTTVKTLWNRQAYQTMGHFCMLAISEEAPKIWWWSEVIYYGKSSLIVKLSRFMIYPIFTHSCMQWPKNHTFRVISEFSFYPRLVPTWTRLHAKFQILLSILAWDIDFLKLVSEFVNTLLRSRYAVHHSDNHSFLCTLVDFF